MSHLSNGCAKDDGGTCCGMCGYTPVVVMATYKRIAITSYNIRTLISYQIPNLKIVLSASDGEVSYYQSHFPEIKVVDTLNNPLGLKWQRGVEEARRLGANPLVILGSDDILIKDYFERGLRLLTAGHDFVGSNTWFMYDDDTEKTYLCSYRGRVADRSLGAGRMISKQLLEEMRGVVFDISAERKLDDKAEFKRTPKSIVINEPCVLSIKGKWNQMNPLSKIMNSMTVEVIDITKEANEKIKKLYVQN